MDIICFAVLFCWLVSIKMKLDDIESKINKK